jgi:hypothetical protein
MKHYESYVAEAQAKRRRRVALGIVGVVMMVTLAFGLMLTFGGADRAESPLARGVAADSPDMARSSGVAYR